MKRAKRTNSRRRTNQTLSPVHVDNTLLDNESRHGGSQATSPAGGWSSAASGIGRFEKLSSRVRGLPRCLTSYRTEYRTSFDF